MLNIKDPEAHRLARQLADAQNITLTEAVIRSLRAALDEDAARRRRVRDALLGEIAAARATRPGTVDSASDAFEDLYDPVTGLPDTGLPDTGLPA